jgi:membrane fusion protein, multidrug efflux system
MIRVRSPLSKLTIASLAAAALAAGAHAAGPAAADAAPRPRVRLVASEPGGAATWVAANVQAARRATVATRLAASVRAVHVEEGQEVAPGQLLVSLADADVRGQLASAEAAFAAASAHERRIRALVAERAATPSELEGATAQRAQAEAAVAAVRANLQYTALRAPIAGTVQARRVDPGDFVGPGQPLVVVEGSALELAASLSEEEARGLRVGQRLPFRAGGVEGTAEITALTRGGDPLSHRRSLRARVAAGAGELRSGAFARLAVPGAGRAAGVWLPQSALVERGDLTGVFVAAAGRAELRWVSIGERVGDRTSVRAGLSAGERVIEDPGALRDGQEIEVLP